MPTPLAQSYLFDDQSAHISRNEQEEINADADNLASMCRQTCICGNVECSIPYGYCHCGCGELAPISKRDSILRSYIKGEPVRYISGHVNIKIPVIEDAVPFKIDGVYCRLIPLTQGLHAIVDASDYEWLMSWNWNAHYSKNTRKYYVRRTECINGEQKTVHMHRVILGLTREDIRNGDHENRNPMDNRRKNLRVANDAENTQNASLRSDNTTGFRGVNWHKRQGKWSARIAVNGKRINLGYFDNIDEARAAYESAALELHKEFASFG